MLSSLLIVEHPLNLCGFQGRSFTANGIWVEVEVFPTAKLFKEFDLLWDLAYLEKLQGTVDGHVCLATGEVELSLKFGDELQMRANLTLFCSTSGVWPHEIVRHFPNR